MIPPVLLGSPSGDRLVIGVVGRMQVVADGFRGHVPAGLRAEELRGFRIGLERAHAEFDGVTADRSGNRLSFRIEGMDQTELPGVIDAPAAIEEEFPVRGSSVD